MDLKQNQILLNKIKSNCEYLSHIKHYNEAKNILNLKTMNGKLLCSVSVAKVAVQMIYLIYTCHILKVDICILSSPLFIKNSKNSFYRAKMVFYLQNQHEQLQKVRVSIKQQVLLIKYNKFNQNVINFLQTIVKNVQQYLYLTKQEQKSADKNVKKFFQYVKSTIQPQILNNGKIKLIKLLQQTTMFYKNSDLLKIYGSSILYKIKQSNKAFQIIKQAKYNQECWKVYSVKDISSHSFHFYKQFDIFLSDLIYLQVLNMNKSTSNDQFKNKQFLVGQVYQINSCKPLYVANFYTLNQRNTKFSKKKFDRNSYFVQYSCQKQLICIKFITEHLVNQQLSDLYFALSQNLCFMEPNLSIQSIQFIQNPNFDPSEQTYICFKLLYNLQSSQSFFTNFLILVQYITICAKIYSDVFYIKNWNNFHVKIEEFNNRFVHANRLFLQKAKHYYQSL